MALQISGGIGLTATQASSLLNIEDEVVEIETHFHSYGKFFERIAVPVGEVNVAVRIGTVGGLGAFIPDAGNNIWGAWVQLLGSSDTPAVVGKTHYDLHRISITDAERNAIYFVQICYGESGAAGLAAGTYDEEVYKPQSNQVDAGPVQIQNRRVVVGTKAWVRVMCPGQDTATLSFFPGLHEYPK